MISVAGLISFFIMIFDSLRQSRAAIRNTFGLNRYNNRVSFYFYETPRLKFVQQKGMFIARRRSVYSKTSRTLNLESLETTLFSHSLAKF